MIWAADQASKIAFWLLIGAFCIQLLWIPIKKFLLVQAAEPIQVTQVERATKGPSRTTIILKTPGRSPL